MHPILNQPLSPAAASLPAAIVIYPLDDLAVFEVAGADALSFLQGQITNDILSLGPEQAKLAGYCTAQGRLLATMVMAALPDTPAELTGLGTPQANLSTQADGQQQDSRAPTSALIGLMRQDILAAVLKRLSMFVLRAKVKLNTSTYSVVGVSVVATEALALSQALGHRLPHTPWQLTATTTGLWICAPAATQQTGAASLRWWWLASDTQAATCQSLKLPSVRGTLGQWHCQDISAGLPWIEASTQDLLIPQTLNLDLIEGVSFTKGCYPGQEIVARSHYRGTVKRRMHLGKLEFPQALSLNAGADIFDAQGSEQACGRVINVASSNSQQTDSANQLGDTGTAYVLFETTFDAIEHNALHLGARDGAPITLLSLPYSTKPA
jgi:folate-binding protein YgfZ